MSTFAVGAFECRMYVPVQGGLNIHIPKESGPKRVARLEPISYDKLVDPGFRRLLVALDSIPGSLQIVQV